MDGEDDDAVDCLPARTPGCDGAEIDWSVRQALAGYLGHSGKVRAVPVKLEV